MPRRSPPHPLILAFLSVSLAAGGAGAAPKSVKAPKAPGFSARLGAGIGGIGKNLIQRFSLGQARPVPAKEELVSEDIAAAAAAAAAGPKASLNLSYSAEEARTAWDGIRSRAGTPVTDAGRSQSEDVHAFGAFLFDQAARSAARKEEAVADPAGRSAPLVRLARAAGFGAPAKRYKNVDLYGGPKNEAPKRGGAVRYGLSGGLALTGFASIIHSVQGVIDAVTPWQFLVGDDVLDSTGRVELLVSMTREQLLEKLAQDPAQALGQLPIQVIGEEVAFRGIGFGLWFGFFAAMRPALLWTADVIEYLPDFLGFRPLVQNFLRATAANVYSSALTVSAASFAAAHAPVWGVQPFDMAVFAVSGGVLTHMAYKTKSLASPIVAHLTYILLGLGGVAAAAVFSRPELAAYYGAALGLVSAYYAARRIRDFRRTRQ